MKKKAFTIIELLVSIVLFGLIVVFASSVISQTRKNNIIYKKQIDKTTKQEIVYDTLYKDIIKSYQVKIKNYKQYTILFLRSRNSIYAINNPYIAWLVLKHKNYLTRIESSRPINLPVLDREERFIFIDPLLKNTDIFQALLSIDKKHILVYIKQKKQKPAIFEIGRL